MSTNTPPAPAPLMTASGKLCICDHCAKLAEVKIRPCKEMPHGGVLCFGCADALHFGSYAVETHSKETMDEVRKALQGAITAIHGMRRYVNQGQACADALTKLNAKHA